MAKESMKAREVKRAKCVAKYAEKRAALKAAGDYEGLQKLPKDHKDETIMKSIIDSMNQLSQKILKNEKIKEIKKEYVQQRKEIEKYIYLIKKLNNFNQCNICPVCFTKTVDHFLRR